MSSITVVPRDPNQGQDPIVLAAAQLSNKAPAPYNLESVWSDRTL